MMSRDTAAMYVATCFTVEPSSPATYKPSTASSGHQGCPDGGWYSSQEVTFMYVRITLHFDLPAEMMEGTCTLWIQLMSHQINQEQLLVEWTRLSNDLASNLNLSQWWADLLGSRLQQFSFLLRAWQFLDLEKETKSCWYFMLFKRFFIFALT
jgi:hypothetical protein